MQNSRTVFGCYQPLHIPQVVKNHLQDRNAADAIEFRQVDSQPW